MLLDSAEKMIRDPGRFLLETDQAELLPHTHAFLHQPVQNAHCQHVFRAENRVYALFQQVSRARFPKVKGIAAAAFPYPGLALLFLSPPGHVVLISTGSPLSTGLVFVAATLPNLLLSPIAGTFVDRWDHKETLIVSDILRAAIVLLISQYVSLGSLSAAVAFPLTMFFRENVFLVDIEGYRTLIYFSLAIALLIIYTHRANIKRLLKGTENRIRFSRRGETTPISRPS